MITIKKVDVMDIKTWRDMIERVSEMIMMADEYGLRGVSMTFAPSNVDEWVLTVNNTGTAWVCYPADDFETKLVELATIFARLPF